MFFVTLLLNQLLGWMRTQSGTTSLRAMLYMDEIFGYFPPVANPPSKLPLLTLLETGPRVWTGRRAGHAEPGRPRLQRSRQHRHVVYRPPANRTRQSSACSKDWKARLQAQGSKFDRSEMEQTLAGLGQSDLSAAQRPRGRTRPVFESRWAMSYLRGPMTRNQIKTLMTPVKSQRNGASSARHPSATPAPTRMPAATAAI